MTFFKSGVKKSRCTQLSVGLATLFVTSTFLFGGESVQADSVARGDDYPLHYKNGSVEIDQWRMYSVWILSQKLGLLLGRQKVIMGTWPGYQMYQGIRLRSKSITMGLGRNTIVAA